MRDLEAAEFPYLTPPDPEPDPFEEMAPEKFDEVCREFILCHDGIYDQMGSWYLDNQRKSRLHDY